MPKTFTDDIAAPFPDLVRGPLRVVDAADPAGYFSIDPANAEVAAFGGARPTRSLETVYSRGYLNNAAQFIGTGIAARSIGPAEVGGFYLFAFRIPETMDVSEPSSVRLLVATANNATTNGQVVRYNLSVTRITPGGVESTINVTHDWPVPNDWQATNPLVIEVNNGNGHTFDAGTFTVGDTIGIRAARLGTDAQDTFDKNVKLAETVGFEYRAKALV